MHEWQSLYYSSALNSGILEAYMEIGYSRQKETIPEL